MMPPKKITNITTPEQREKNLEEWVLSQKKATADMIEKHKNYMAKLTADKE